MWHDPAGDFDEVFEFVTTGLDRAVIAFFLSCMHRAMFEQKYGTISDNVSDEDLAEFIWT